jgi:phosphoglycolate phosphatase
MNIIFDLDGTLVDSRMRLYSLFQQLTPESFFCFNEYWDLKKSRHTHRHILSNIFGKDSTAIDIFESNWMRLIESESLLAIDKLFPYIKVNLKLLAQHATLHLCTARQFRDSTMTQIEQLGILPYFQNILVTGQKLTKEDIIRQNITDLSNEDWMVGDSGKDILSGKTLGIRTCAVLSGFMSETYLREYKPDLILDNAAGFNPFFL